MGESSGQLIRITSDDQQLTGLLRKLEQVLAQAGAYLDTGLEIRVKDGLLSVHAGGAKEKYLVRLPEKCLLPIDDVQFVVRDGELAIAAEKTPLAPERRELFDLMLAIYRHTHKISHHRSECPWLAFANHPRLLQPLAEGRVMPKYQRYRKLAESGDLDTLAIETYWGSRVLDYQPAANERGDKSPKSHVLMPLIDFFNHHGNAKGFGKQPGLLGIELSQPLVDSDECFVRYNFVDALESYLSYGFVDRSSTFLRSVPTKVELRGIGRLVILGQGFLPRKNPPPKDLRDIALFVPRWNVSQSGEIVLHSLMLPTQHAPQTVHRVLIGAIRLLGKAVPAGVLQPAVDQAVISIVEANQAYYRNLAAMLEQEAPGDSQAKTELELLIRLQLEKLANYRARLPVRWPAPQPPGVVQGISRPTSF